MKSLKKVLCLVLVALMLVAVLAACADEDKGDEGSKAPDPVNTKTGTYDEMVAYLTAKGYIAEGTTPVDINVTEGYVTDNTGGDFPFVTIADKANDYGGLWLFWWDLENPTENYDTYTSMAMNSGFMVFMGGAAVLGTEANSGAFAIAFAEDYAQKDAVLADFNALPNA